MAKINILDKTIANRISAGEVVEKPASIVKELVENSIDAGATKIIIEIEQGGIRKISISDDGVGILKEDVKNAFLPHATSKIKNLDDLFSIQSLGFRGEALASISAVSHVEILTKTADEALGSMLEIKGGEYGDLQEVSCNRGTSIKVSNLFYNTPARLKFLRKPKTEERDITDLIEKFMLSNPKIKFSYIVDGKTVYNTTGSGLTDIIYTIYGKETAKNLIEINDGNAEFFIRGFIGNPQIAKQNRTYQTLMVNGRIVKNLMISTAISNAFDNFLMKGKFPFFVLNLSVPYNSVDVNIHPSKQEIKFENSNAIYNLFYNVVSKALFNAQHIGKIEEKEENKASFEDNNIHIEKNFQILSREEGKSFNLEENLEVEEKNTNFFELDQIEEHKIEINPISINNNNLKPHITDDLELKTDESYISQMLLNKGFKNVKIENENVFKEGTPLKIIGTIFNTYIVTEKENLVYLIDQHAAHERNLYDKYMAQIESQTLSLQEMLLPYTFECSGAEMAFFSENIAELEKLGFIFEIAGLNTVRINAIPFVVCNLDLDKFVYSLKANLEGFNRNSNQFLKEYIAEYSCKHAIKAGDVLPLKEIEKIIENLKNQQVLLCPHGRPIVIEITKKQIEKWFKRIV